MLRGRLLQAVVRGSRNGFGQGKARVIFVLARVGRREQLGQTHDVSALRRRFANPRQGGGYVGLLRGDA